VSAFFGNVDITLWREATESEKEEHRLRMESKEII
jgi:hypothetical protein